MDGPERHRIGLEIEVERGRIAVAPGDWDVDDLLSALREGVAHVRRVVRGRVTDEEHDPLSTTIEGWADDLDQALQLHWLVSSSPTVPIQPAPGAPRPSLETLVELRALLDQSKQVAGRLRAEGL